MAPPTHKPSLKPAPVTLTDRAPALDVLRGFAVLGILVMNLPTFASASAAYFDPTIGSLGFTGLDRLLWQTSYLFVDTKFMTLFSMLFGAGVILLADRAAARGTSAISTYYRRLGFLAIFGLAHAYLLWYGDILFTYAVCGLLLWPLRNLRTAWLLLLAALLSLIPVATLGGLGWLIHAAREAHNAALASGQPPAAGSLAELYTELKAGFDPPPEDLQREVDAYRGSFAQAFLIRAESSLVMQLFMIPAFALWRCTAAMLLGMALLRWGILSAHATPRTLLAVALPSLAVGIALSALGMDRMIAHDFHPADLFRFDIWFNYFGSYATATGYAASIALLVRLNPLPFLTRTLQTVGRMAFSNYILQSLLCTTLFYGYGFGLFDQLNRSQLVLVLLAVWTTQIAASLLYARKYNSGPLEALWRRLSYGRPNSPTPATDNQPPHNPPTHPPTSPIA